MNRIAYVILRKINKVPFWFNDICRYSKKEDCTMEEKYGVLKNVVRNVNIAANVNIICTGVENLPEEQGYILTPNHEGLFDVLLIADTHEKPLSFVIKKELENTILLKQVIRLVGAKAMDRDDVRQSMQIIKEVTEELKEEKNFIIFPEGTRSKIPNQPDKFKGGTFKSAVKAKAPIVPVALIDSYKPFDINTTEEVTVQVHYLEPLYYDDYKEMKTSEIAELVRNKVIEKINEEINKIK